MFSCFSPLLVPFFSCTWCAQAWQWPLFKVSTQVSSHFSPSHFLKHTPHFLSDYFFWVIWPFLCPTFCWIIWAYLAVGADFALGTLTDSSPAFSRPVFSPGRPTTTSCLYEAGMQKDLWQQHNKNLSGVENVEATFEFHLFCKSPACAFYTVHCTGTPFSAWQKGKCKRVNRGGGSI